MFNKKLFTLLFLSILVLQVIAKPKHEHDKFKIYSVKDKEFREYGRIVEGYSVKEIMKALKKTPVPKDGTVYSAEDEGLMATSDTKKLAASLYGGMPYQFGYCNGHNTKMNCLEYHRDSEFNLGTDDFILILAKRTDIVNGKIDSSKAKAFRVPKGVLIEVYGSTLHYAPCHTDPKKGFQVLIALPKGTNVGTSETAGQSFEDKTLFATNKWLYAHKDAAEVADGAYVGITGKNIDIAKYL